MKGLIFLALLAANFLLGANHSLAQGSLTPPGAPGPSMKTLDQLEPRQPISTIGYNITTAGSYYLTTNLNGSTNGLIIASDNVSIDLSGFTITGNGSNYGILVSGIRTNLTIQNGTVTRFAGGIAAITANYGRFDRLKLIQAGNGFDVGNSAIVTDCAVYGCAYGINAGANAIVRSCMAQKNTGSGIVVGDNSVVSGCTAAANTGTFIHGIVLRNACTITDSTSFSNSFYGISMGEGSVAKNCTSRSNAYGGFSVNACSMITGCTASGNAAYGIFTSHGNTIKDCTVDGNLDVGIFASYDCQIVGNNCSANGPSVAAKGAGIYVGDSPCRIEANNVTGNYYGIQVTTTSAGANALIIRNSASGNTTNYVFSGGIAGPIVTSATIGSSSNPNANYSY